MILGLTDWVVPRMGPQGFWIGFIVGLTSAALMLGARLPRHLRPPPAPRPAQPSRGAIGRGQGHGEPHFGAARL